MIWYSGGILRTEATFCRLACGLVRMTLSVAQEEWKVDQDQEIKERANGAPGTGQQKDAVTKSNLLLKPVS